MTDQLRHWPDFSHSCGDPTGDLNVVEVVVNVFDGFVVAAVVVDLVMLFVLLLSQKVSWSW